MTIETRPRAARPGEDTRRKHHNYRVRWRLGGGSGPKQSTTVDTLTDAQALEVAVKDHGYPAAADPFVKSLAIIGANIGAAAPAPAAVTLADAFAAYAARTTIGPATRKNLRNGAARFPAELTARNLYTITADDLAPCLADIDERFAPTTAYETRILLRSVLALHGRADLAPRLAQADRTVEPHYLSRTEIETLAVAADKYGLGDVVRVTGQTGLRWGEVMGLETRHVDRDRRVVMVRQQLPQTGVKTWTPGPPKSKRSRRDVPLTDASLAVIDAYVAANPPTGPALFAPPPGGHSGHLVPRNPWWNYGTFWARWDKAVADAGLGPVRFHDLRHSAAKQMLDNGVRLDVVSKILGHASVLITAMMYGGIDDVTLDAARAAFA